ncbi:hypothetical protein [Pseudanabaena mucicola]|uniref:Uncharacterized protein n=1 Tax=Pseudanabaena mucicola FACHB-723 TaxID=2692860 RepID=A0ABR7ZWB2_9CYAN|nr:hypothetical protein [Pseudanabaena mucicola]MBD2187770.1 hypothetical protein [Pseudanabaena mucicola FACHB-723]
MIKEFAIATEQKYRIQQGIYAAIHNFAVSLPLLAQSFVIQPTQIDAGRR